MRFGGPIFGRAYFWEGLVSEFYGISFPVSKFRGHSQTET